ncbi:uncharacterized protein LOC131619196 [Vicia villosa]|uniref:uncharacterized protein LOC131619196 n=1 Tax=Vicia villosa TaxID=3911 RepID=UPI00273AF587|nr:uncharacterized protein LOC131619196 [Vicia villosa]
MANQRDYQPRKQPYQANKNNQGYQHRVNNQGLWQDGRNSNRQNSYNAPPPQEKPSKMEETLTQFMQVSMENQKSNEESIKNFKTQVGQLAKQLAEKQPGASFSGNTLTYPKEHCKEIITRNGRVVENEVGVEIVNEEDVVEKEKEQMKNYEELFENEIVELEKKKMRKKDKVKEAKKKVKSSIPIKIFPYPHAPSKKDDSRLYAWFMDIFKQLQIIIPFSEAIDQILKYAKFMKDILTKKKRYTEEETIMVDARFSAIIQRTLPKKEGDPGRVTLPVMIGDVYVGKGLIDLGSSINLIPLSIVNRLGNFEMRSIRMTLQLADKSTTSPHGVALDLLVKVDKFFFLVDFVVINMEEDVDAPLIICRPFMKTARMMIDVDDGLMKVRVQDE